MKRLTILGSTGTIGQNALKLVAAHPDRFALGALTAATNVTLLIEQARRFTPRRAVIADAQHYAALKEGLAGTGIEAAAGLHAVCDVAGEDAEIVLSAIVGIAGLKPTMAAISAGARVALANKESLVCAGALMTAEVARCGAELIPVDSEHSALFQLLEGRKTQGITRLTLTASGGPFRDWSIEQMRSITPAQAVKHPNWNMGAKISVDSATMMNKGLELIEAQALFPFAPRFDVLVHPQSIVHALVEMADGSVLAQLSAPDMMTPIAVALSWPERLSAPAPKLDLAALGSLTFFAPDETRFPALALARAAMEAGGSAPCILNAANEVAVAQFLSGAIRFTEIASRVEATLARMPATALSSIDDVLATDAQARATITELSHGIYA